jgi:hypothetical protein
MFPKGFTKSCIELKEFASNWEVALTWPRLLGQAGYRVEIAHETSTGHDRPALSGIVSRGDMTNVIFIILFIVHDTQFIERSLAGLSPRLKDYDNKYRIALYTDRHADIDRACSFSDDMARILRGAEREHN